MSLTNVEIAELLARASDEVEDFKRKAYRRASRAALGWEREASEVVAAGASLTELRNVGPKLSGLIARWLEAPPEVADPPPSRRDFSSLSDARAFLAGHPDWRTRNKGDLQMHTTYSDGTLPISGMAGAALALGYEYIAITDHSQGLKIAGGMDEAELAAQTGEIDSLNAQLSGAGSHLRIVKAIEMNVSPEGAGDMDRDALGTLELVLGSFHSKLRLTEDQTPRYLAALANPDVHVLGHPRGRMYNFRVGLNANWDEVFHAAAEKGKAIEIDCHPNRQDLNIELLRLAAEHGVYISIGTDAHSEPEMWFVDIGLAAALRAGIAGDRILNFMTVEELLSWAAEVRAAA